MKKKLWVATGILLILLVAVYFIQDTMAKYRKRISVETKVEIASWNIKVNNESILGKTALTQAIQPTFAGDLYTKEGVLAPGSKGYYDIVIDPTEVDVAFHYKVISEVDPNSDVQDFITTSYIIDPKEGKDPTLYPTDSGIEGDFFPNGQPFTIRIYVLWNDDPASEAMDNQQDTEIANNKDAKALISVNIHFSQLKNT